MNAAVGINSSELVVPGSYGLTPVVSSVAKFHEIYNFEIFHVNFKKILETFKKSMITRPRQVQTMREHEIYGTEVPFIH